LLYSQLDKRFQRHISNRVLRCTVILKDTHPQVKFDVFERLNSGAVALTRQELRHGLYYGKLLKAAAKVAIELKLDKHFGRRVDKRMKAEELVLRYWALNQGIGMYEKPLATFITNYAESNRNPNDEDLVKLLNEIRSAHARATILFGEHCFSFSTSGKRRFNAAVFDAQMAASSRLTASKFRLLEEQIDVIQAQYVELQDSPDYTKSVTLATSDKAALQGRIHRVTALLKSFL
jgi:hypothetical protein